jgi:hypothetical protein
MAASLWSRWRHGPTANEDAERIDRIRNPRKYLDEVNRIQPDNSPDETLPRNHNDR